MIHYLKTWPAYYWRVYENIKTFEVRKNDRDFQVNDIVVLQEYDPAKKELTGNEIQRQIKYILHGDAFGLARGYCVLQLGNYD